MSLLPRTNPLAVCPVCGSAHALGQLPCAPPEVSPGVAEHTQPAAASIPPPAGPPLPPAGRVTTSASPTPATGTPPHSEPGRIARPTGPDLEAAPAPSHTPSARPLSEEKIRSLVDQGIIVEEDARGLRLTGKPVRGRGKQTGQLSATDIVRLAADLDGGVLPPEQRRHCHHCDAVVPLQATRCEWCGKSLAAPAA